jgi:hypothetical protein
MFDAFIYAKNGNYRTVMSTEVESVTAAGISDAGQRSGVWYNTADEITSITITSEYSNAFEPGTVVELWKLNA